MEEKRESVENRKVTEMSLEELSTLKQIVDTESERYANMLTTYTTMYEDPYLENIGQNERMMYLRRIRYVRLKELVEEQIDAKLEKLCEKNNV